MQHEGATAVREPSRTRPGYLPALAALSSLAVLIANASGIATGDDGVGYRATADSLLAGDGLGYFLEQPLTVWPPVWPALMAAVARVTPLDTLGAAIVLNAAVAFAVVIVGNRLLRSVVTDERLILLGTIVFAFGPTTIGFGRLLMTDMAFALVTMTWMLALFRFRRTGALTDLAMSAALVWLGFGLRYVGLVLIAFGGSWILLDHRRRVVDRLRDGVVYGVASSVVPVAWMLRNHSIDGTFTGERHASQRGLLENAFDVAATVGRFLLPGLGYGMTRLWAVVGLVAVLIAAWLSVRVLRARHGDRVGPRTLQLLGGPVGLLAIVGVLYLVYMLYVRTTTALNQLDVRLLYPSYFPLLVLALVLVDQLRRTGDDRARPAFLAAVGWASLNVVAGMVAMVAFALGHPYFDGNYESESFQDVRSSEALDALPQDCRVYSNLPNGLYPEVEALWSPMRTALESADAPDPGYGLEDIAETLDDTPSCLVWIDLPPAYGHVHPLEELDQRLDLTRLDGAGDVEVFRMDSPD